MKGKELDTLWKENFKSGVQGKESSPNAQTAYSKNWKNLGGGATCFTIGVIFVFLYLMALNKPVTFYYDEGNYLRLGAIFQEYGLFNIKAFAQYNESIRGYFFPWLIALLHNHLFIWNIAVAALASGLCTIIAPGIIECSFSSIKVGVWGRLCILALFTVLYSGHLAYVLSDIWACGFAALGIYMFLLALRADKGLFRLAMYAISGFFLGAAYNTRTIYLFAVVVCIVMLAVRVRQKQSICIFISFLVGILLISMPQIVSNYYEHGAVSPLVITGEGGGLFTDQLYWGIRMQKYETYIGGDFQPNTVYPDAAGATLWQEEQLNEAEYTMINYISIVLRHPLDFAGIYMRHFINMVDMRYPEQYISSLKPNWVIPVINYTILYLFFAAALPEVKKQKGSLKACLKEGWYILLLMLPTLAITPGAVEPRFAMMFHIVVFSMVAAFAHPVKILSYEIDKKICFVLGYAIFVAVICAICGNTMASLPYMPTIY